MSQNKITPALWFHTADGKMGHVTSYYSNIFETNFEAGDAMPLGETPSGNTEMCNIKLLTTPTCL